VNFFSDEKVQNFISAAAYDPYVGTALEGYCYLHPKKKGKIGEEVARVIMEASGWEVTKPTNPGHDRTIGGIKTEVKFSVANPMMINHLSIGKDWERLLFIGVDSPENVDNPTTFFIYKEDFLNMIDEEHPAFKNQQGGKKLDNDDYIVPNVSFLLSDKRVRDIAKW
jgi:hypothetical protein